jgi:hypothetical protein
MFVRALHLGLAASQQFLVFRLELTGDVIQWNLAKMKRCPLNNQIKNIRFETITEVVVATRHYKLRCGVLPA